MKKFILPTLGLIVVLFLVQILTINSDKNQKISADIFDQTASAPIIKVQNLAPRNTQSMLMGPTSITSSPIPAPNVMPVAFERPFLIGGTDGNGVSNNVLYSSNGGSLWNQVFPNTSFTPRARHTGISFQNKMWIMGGTSITNEFSDVWSSTDGTNWILATANAPWTTRVGHSSVTFNGQMFVIGGGHFTAPLGRAYFNDVWSSTDGINWTQVIANASWTARTGHASVIFNNKIFIMGGERPGPGPLGWQNPINLNDVWSSPDGINWTQVTANAPWAGRQGHTAIVYNGKIYVIGGGYYTPLSYGAYLNDVWSSPDGMNWTLETASAPWPVRISHMSPVFDDKMWVIGGANWNQSVNTAYSDAWSSVDGINWAQQTNNIPNLYGGGSAAVVMP